MLFFCLVYLTTSLILSNPNCPQGHHWVKAHHRREYYRANGTLVSASDVKAHCRKNFSGFDSWNLKLKNERPQNWRHTKEQTTQWATEEIERVLEALDEIPNILKEQGINAIYRMQKSQTPKNPASTRGNDIVLYDDAFEKDYVLADVLGHELAHQLFFDLKQSHRSSFLKAGQWKDEGGREVPSRPESQFKKWYA